MNTEEEEKEKYLASQKRRIECAERDGWTDINAVFISGNDSYYESFWYLLGKHKDFPNGWGIPEYPLQRLIATTWDGEHSFTIPFLFESKEAAETLFLSTLIKKKREKEENDRRFVDGGDYKFIDTLFELFGIEFDIHSDPKFYTLDEWFAGAYSPEKSES